MADDTDNVPPAGHASNAPDSHRVSGHGGGAVDTVISVEEASRQAAALAAERPDRATLQGLVRGDPIVRIKDLHAGYGVMEILHGIDLFVGTGQSLCLIGPNGAGKSTILHAIYGLADIHSGSIHCHERDITRMPPNRKLAEAGVAYILQDNSVFPDMTVWENILMGGVLMPTVEQASQKGEELLQRYERLAARRDQPARVLSGGERRLLEITRALVMDPNLLLVDEPSIGLEPRYIDMVFEILADLQYQQGKTIIMVEQNAKKGLDFADLGYVLVAGEIAMAGPGDSLLANPEVGRLFLGG